MALKLFRAAWFLSVLLVLANLLYVYASLPERVTVGQAPQMFMNKEWLFYAAMLSMVGVNLLVYLFKWIYRGEGLEIRSWLHGQLITINIFFIIALQALNVYNSAEIFDHNRVAFFLTGSLSLIVLWAAAWPFYLLFQKFFVKAAI